MALRKEQTLLVGTLVVLGWLLWSSQGAGSRRASTTKRAEPPALVRHPAPDLALVTPPSAAARSGAAPGAGITGRASDAALSGDDARELFAPPSDTRPLGPLGLETPPLVPLPILRPPPEPGPNPKLYGRLLRSPAVTFDVPDLFAGEASAAASGDEIATPADAGGDARRASDVTPQERAERIGSYKRLYDWYRVVDLKFGQILNSDRFGLAERPEEALLFVEFNPATGLPRLIGQGAVPIPRANVAEFGFADTVANQIEIRRAEFGDPLSAGEYEQAIVFAYMCIEQRLETPRALEIAEEMFRRALPVLEQDPAPRLGLARCYEAGFQFERAFQEYRAMLDGAYARNPLVLVRLAELEARFRLRALAEERFAEAERYGRTLWQVQFSYGRFLNDGGRAADAIAHLRLANQYEPAGPEYKLVRARMRAELGRALLANGEIAEAAEWYDKARQADPSEQRAEAGLLAAGAIGALGSNGPKNALNGSSAAVARASESAGETSAATGFDLLVAGAIEALARPDAATLRRARQDLLLAASADPLRAYVPWRTLAWLAEATNSPEEALRFVELAVENNPTDPWTLYQRGRILAARDDLDGARESFSRALDQELDFPDALAAIGELAHRRGDFASADRYLERALALDPKLVSVIALRGVNFLELGDLGAAQATFEQALALEPEHPTARNGLAWCFYRKGDPGEAQTRFRELDDNRRALPEDDPHRAYAIAQIARISDHLEKVVWTDRFERRTLLNGWDVDEKVGPQVTIHDGVVSLAGAFSSNGRARLFQQRPAGAFVAFEARLVVKKDSTARVGLFVSREMARASETQIEAEVTVSRHPDSSKNTVQTRVMKRGEEDLEHTDVPGSEWKLDTPIVLRIERTGESGDTRVRVLVDGFPVLDGKAMPNLGKTTTPLRIGVYAEGQTGKKVDVEIDDVEIVYRK